MSSTITGNDTRPIGLATIARELERQCDLKRARDARYRNRRRPRVQVVELVNGHGIWLRSPR